MSAEAWLTLGIIALILGLLIFTRKPPDVIVAGGVTLLLLSGVLTPEEALAGLSNPAMAAVGVLFIVAAGLRETGSIDWLAHHLLGNGRSLVRLQTRIMVPTVAVSAFMNNTPVVAMLIPAISDFARRHRLATSKLMIPLSYAAILGGTCTLIGTSTNLVVNSLLIEQTGRAELGLFTIAWVGLPVAIMGIIYVLLLGHWLLPDRKPVFSHWNDPREYTLEMLLQPNSPLVERTIEDAGLRNLPGIYLVEINRQNQIIPAVRPNEKLQPHDRLVFVGVIDTVKDLQKIRGLMPATDQVFKLDSPRAERCLIEAVVSNTCRLIGTTIRAGQFRSVYNAVVIAAARNGERIRGKIGDIILQPGDTLLLETRPSFLEQQRNSRDFFLVSEVADSSPPRHDRAWIALIILVLMVIAVTLQWLSLLEAALTAAGLMLVTGCLQIATARRSVDWQVLMVIAASLALGQALQNTGAAAHIAHIVLKLIGDNPWGVLAAVHFLTALMTELITNNAAAVLMFPIALAAADSLGVNFTPFAISIMVAASASFATPIGYQTNLMVYGPGGYHFTDYLRIGLPLNFLVWSMTVFIAPQIWPF
ncbi:SLC13 family permease [Nitrosococcus watsonii]|uniref:Citrate transporter n=1 Tax=Nitrosococcus watsoni (strain C-113) TaxID=105559 RepID=D8K722_NITWC|nr:Citrate transporter [Nitrosococcus watsonii C-113]